MLLELTNVEMENCQLFCYWKCIFWYPSFWTSFWMNVCGRFLWCILPRHRRLQFQNLTERRQKCTGT